MGPNERLEVQPIRVQYDGHLPQRDGRRLVSDVSAALFDELTVRDYSHKTGTATQTKFELGKANAVREDRAYYLTVFITQNGKRTHMGEKDGKRGLCKVLNRGNASTVEMIVREVGR